MNLETIKDAKQLNGLALAYMGDAVLEVYVRHHLLKQGMTRPNDLHRQSRRYVSAKSQASMLFALEASTLSERRNARRDSIRHRVQECAAQVNASDEAWIVWCELNAEADALREAIPDAVEVRGSDTTQQKERALHDFAHGKIRVLITKPKIAGFGLNWQHCKNVAFVGVTDSFESYYQAVRRCWRFGQKREVDVYLYVSELEGSVLANLMRKESDALAMFESLSRETRDAVQSAVLGSRRESNPYNARNPISIPSFLEAS